MGTFRSNIIRDEIVFDNPSMTSISMYDIVWPRTTLDAVYDNMDPNEITLRELLKQIRDDISTGGGGLIKFPVTSVNGMYNDVIINKDHIGLSNVANIGPMDMPLSNPQRTDILSILASYDFGFNMEPLYSHISDYNNPHKVTTNQLNEDNSISSLINDAISNHDSNSLSHINIQNTINDIINNSSNDYNDLNNKLSDLLININNHKSDDSAHINLFNKKEDISNKVIEFSKTLNNDSIKYPTTNAVINYIDKISNDIINNSGPSRYVAYLQVIQSESNLPTPSINNYQYSYLIKQRNENSIYSALASCRISNNNYVWEVQDFTINKFDPDFFNQSSTGLSINIDKIFQSNPSYNKSESDQRYLQSINITSGTSRGTIKYVLDSYTTVDNIPVTGLKNLAFLDQVSSNEIKEQSLLSQHFTNNSINGNFIAPKSITNSHIFTNTIIEENIATAAISNRTIRDYSITGNKLPSQTLEGFHIKNGTIQTGQLALNSIIESTIADNAVTTNKLSFKSVTTDKISDGSVINEKLSYMPSKTIKGNISNVSAYPTDISMQELSTMVLADASFKIGTNNIVDNSITLNKIADNSINGNKIIDGSITNVDIANSTITNAKLANMPSLTFKGNASSISNTPQDVTIAALTSTIDTYRGYRFTVENGSLIFIYDDTKF